MVKIYLLIFLAVVAYADKFNADECGTKKTCHSLPANCSPAECEYTISFAKLYDQVMEIELYANRPETDIESGNIYVAVGFSADSQMVCLDFEQKQKIRAMSR